MGAVIFKYDIDKILEEVNNEADLIPYWIKLDLMEKGVPIEIDAMDVGCQYFRVETGSIDYSFNNGIIYIWYNSTDK